MMGGNAILICFLCCTEKGLSLIYKVNQFMMDPDAGP